MKVIRSSDCGNSPKQKLLEDMSVALAGADAGLIDSLAVPELVATRWEKAGRRSGRRCLSHPKIRACDRSSH
jgi:hypothetical protein